MVLDGAWPKMENHNCLEDLEGRMRLKRLWKLVSQVGKRRGTNDLRPAVILVLGRFYQNGVAPHRNLGGGGGHRARKGIVGCETK